MDQETATIETTETDTSTDAAVAPQAEILVEEISIDGMCGVY